MDRIGLEMAASGECPAEATYIIICSNPRLTNAICIDINLVRIIEPFHSLVKKIFDFVGRLCDYLSICAVSYYQLA